MKSQIGIIGQFAPPIHGVSKALDTIGNSYLRDKYNLINFDIKDNKKILKSLKMIIKSKCDLYYFTISQSKYGNIRDLIIIFLLIVKRKKVLIHFHGGGFRILLEKEVSKIQRLVNYNILSKVEGAIVLGESLRYIFKDIIDERKIYVVKNCIDNEFLISKNDLEIKISEFKKKRKLNIIYLSNFIRNKGYEEVLELANLCNKKNDSRFKFIFAGDFLEDNTETEFFEFIKNNCLQNIIEYKGIVFGEEKRDLLESGDIFILPLKNKKEGQPISIIEAVANGLIIITTDLIGIRDIVNEDSSFKHDCNNIDIYRIYNEIVDIYNHREQYIDIIKNNRLKIEEEFSEEKYLSNIEKLFDDIINKNIN